MQAITSGCCVLAVRERWVGWWQAGRLSLDPNSSKKMRSHACIFRMQRGQRKPDLNGPSIAKCQRPPNRQRRWRHWLFTHSIHPPCFAIISHTMQGITLPPLAPSLLSTTAIDDETDYKQQGMLFNTHMTPKQRPGGGWPCNVDGDDSLPRPFPFHPDRTVEKMVWISRQPGARGLGQTPSERAVLLM